MFCPECQAEYRVGFTRCADCDVDLMTTKAEAVRQRHIEVAADTGPYDLLLWKGTDTDFYLSLLGGLDGFGIERIGRAINPPMREEFSSELEEPEFGVWISKQDYFLGRWILNSGLEIEAEEDAFLELKRHEPENDPEEGTERTGYVCVLCSAEYSEAISDCPNCGIPLKLAQEVPHFDGSVRSLSNFAHPQFTDALRMELRRAGIPFENSNLVGGKTLVGPVYIPNNHVTVLDSDYDRAKRIFGNLLRRWQFDVGLAPTSPKDPAEAYWPDRAERNWWLPEDLTAEAWTGTNLYKLSGVGRALREFEIPYSVLVEEPMRAKILVHPEDGEKARDLAREVLEGSEKG
jgi:hypothetical protein